jgi:mannosyltransferase OCH1-like enzyme
MIPKVHQIFFSDAGSADLKGYARKATRSVRSTFRDHEYRLWYLDDATSFIRERFPDEVLWAFQTLVPYAYRADFFKYCLLRELGGWVADLGVRMLKSPVEMLTAIKSESPRFVLFRSTGAWDPPWNCSVALLYAESGHPVFDTAIGYVIENCRRRYYGHTPLAPTMSALGRSLAHHEVHEGARIGKIVSVSRRSYGRAFELWPGRHGLVAARKPKGINAGDISSIGVSGANDYAQLWRDREVYAEIHR